MIGSSNSCNVTRCTWKDEVQSLDSNKVQKITREVTATLKQFTEPNQLLLMGLQFFAGYNKNFQFGDLTRAYTSCVYGVAQVRKLIVETFNQQ